MRFSTRRLAATGPSAVHFFRASGHPASLVRKRRHDASNFSFQPGGRSAAPQTLNDAIEQLKRRMIEDALRECGSKTRAAERLGLTRQSLQQMLRRRSADS